MAADTLPCPECSADVVVSAALSVHCRCDDLADDHGPDGCRLCACAVYEEAAVLSCPDCLALLGDSLPGRERRAA